MHGSKDPSNLRGFFRFSPPSKQKRGYRKQGNCQLRCHPGWPPRTSLGGMGLRGHLINPNFDSLCPKLLNKKYSEPYSLNQMLYSLLSVIFIIVSYIQYCQLYSLLLIIFIIVSYIHYCQLYSLLSVIFIIVSYIHYCQLYSLLSVIFIIVSYIHYCH